MKTNVYFTFVLAIIFPCLLGMFHTFLPEQLSGFFGDVYIEEYQEVRIEWGNEKTFVIESHWDWGARHYWYQVMMVFLYLLSLTNIGLIVAKVINKNYDI